MVLTITENITKAGYEIRASSMKNPVNNRVIAHQASKEQVIQIVSDMLMFDEPIIKQLE